MNGIAVHTIVFCRQEILSFRGYGVFSELKMFWVSDFKIHMRKIPQCRNWRLKEIHSRNVQSVVWQVSQIQRKQNIGRSVKWDTKSLKVDGVYEEYGKIWTKWKTRRWHYRMDTMQTRLLKALDVFWKRIKISTSAVIPLSDWGRSRGRWPRKQWRKPTAP